jgi:two-component system, OmpR family, sensor histidine kinase BaeS
MRRSLKGKRILSYLVVALITVLVVSVLIRLNSGQSLMNMVVEEQIASLKESAQSYYTSHSTMDGFFDYYVKMNPMLPRPSQPGIPDNGPKKQDIRGLHGLIDPNYRALIPTFGYDPGQIVPKEMIQQSIPVQVDGQTVAWILPDNKFQFKLSAEEELFLQRTTMAIGLAALGGILVAVTMGFFLAGGLLKPIRRLTSASQALAHGDLQQQVPVTSTDELGQLTTTFNQMSADLARVDQQRKRMTADITHDLSTPLQVISGYVEMLEEGEVSLTPQRIETIKTEIGHLRRLVGDLSTLTQVEASELDIQLQPVQPHILLDRIYTAYQPIAARQGVEVVKEADTSQPSILVDEGRMLQVLKNLVENALRYTPRGGSITLGSVVTDRVLLSVKDTGSGIYSEDLPYVFDRFYRADKSRGAGSGKLELGLAICKALVNAQGGEISAASAGEGKGTTILITFPYIPMAI